MTTAPHHLLQRRAALIGAAASLAALGAARAAPAPWYYWRSKLNGARVCAQTSPGEGWVQDSEPYEGPMCQPHRRVFVLPEKQGNPR